MTSIESCIERLVKLPTFKCTASTPKLILIDGFDELRPDSQTLVIEAIKRLAEDGRLKFIVSGSQRMALTQADVTHYSTRELWCSPGHLSKLITGALIDILRTPADRSDLLARWERLCEGNFMYFAATRRLFRGNAKSHSRSDIETELITPVALADIPHPLIEYYKKHHDLIFSTYLNIADPGLNDVLDILKVLVAISGVVSYRVTLAHISELMQITLEEARAAATKVAALFPPHPVEADVLVPFHSSVVTWLKLEKFSEQTCNKYVYTLLLKYYLSDKQPGRETIHFARGVIDHLATLSTEAGAAKDLFFNLKFLCCIMGEFRQGDVVAELYERAVSSKATDDSDAQALLHALRVINKVSCIRFTLNIMPNYYKHTCISLTLPCYLLH